VAGCDPQLALDARRACLEKAAAGSGLAAQNALFALGVLERDELHDGPAAVSRWRGFQARFPDGLLASEASIAILGELVAQRRYPEAIEEAAAFQSQFADDSRAVEVGALRSSLLAIVR
jgi:hypothetical protein